MFTMVVLWVHLMAMAFWMGGMLFQWIVLNPILIGENPTSKEREIYQRVWQRFRTFRWLSLITLIITGVMNLLYEGGSARLESEWGGILMIKLFLVVIAIGLSFAYDIMTAPKLGISPSQGSSGSEKYLSLGIILVGFFTILIALYLTRY